MKFLPKKQSGMTFVELAVILALLIVIGVILITFYVGYSNSLSTISASEYVNTSASAVIKDTSTSLLLADAILATHTFAGTVYTSGANTLVVELPSINSVGTILTGKHDYIVYYINSGIIYKRIDADASSARQTSMKAISNMAQSLTFTYNNASMSSVTAVTVDVQTQTTVRNQTIQSHLTQQVYLRNK